MKAELMNAAGNIITSLCLCNSQLAGINYAFSFNPIHSCCHCETIRSYLQPNVHSIVPLRKMDVTKYTVIITSLCLCIPGCKDK